MEPAPDLRAISSTRASWATRLEADGLIALADRPFSLSDEEAKLLILDLSDGRAKNISLSPKGGEVRGALSHDRQGMKRAADLMERYAGWARDLVGELAPDYVPALERGRTSFRPRDARAAPASPRKDDRRLHVDAFPSQPTGGKRILRVFSNINPSGEPRRWQVGETFETFARRWIKDVRPLWPGEAWLLRRLRITRARRAPYDQLMLTLHDRAKLDAGYQQSAPRQEIAFPAGTSWIVFTDSVVHAAVRGRYALEQTFYLPVEALIDQAASPLHILERLTGRALA